MIGVTLVCVTLGVWLGWAKYERARMRQKARVAQVLEEKGADFAWDGDSKPVVQRQRLGADETWDYTTQSRFCAQLPNHDGEMERVVVKLTCDDTALLSSTFPTLRYVQFEKCQIAGGGIKQLAKLPKLEKLTLVDTPISDDELKALKDALPKLEIVRTHWTTAP